MIGALELDDLVSFAKGASDTHCIKVRFGTAAHEAHLFRAGHRVHDLFRQLDGGGIGGVEVATVLEGFRHRPGHAGVGMTDQHGPHAQEIVDVFVAAVIVELRASSRAHDDRVLGIVVDIAGRAARQILGSFLEKLGFFRAPRFELFHDLLSFEAVPNVPHGTRL